MNKKIHVKTGDTVMIISGKDRGKVGKIMQVSPKEGKVIVENANFVQQACQAPQNGRGRRHHQGRGRYLCLQGTD